MLTKDGMKNVMGGHPPVNWCVVICHDLPGDAWRCTGINGAPSGNDLCSVLPPDPNIYQGCFVLQYCAYA